MGIIDIEGKKYLSNTKYFADLFNFILYDGDRIIEPEKLKKLDSTEITIPYGNDSRVPIQKYRDIIKLWAVMMDEDAVYVMLGAELQSSTHFAMPVKKGLYDMIGYANQVEEARNSYKKEKAKTGNVIIDDGTIKIKLTSEEFLSGFRKSDKLIPIITVTVFLSDEEWDGPLSLHDMLDINDERLLKFIPDCPINLIAPYKVDDADFGKFSTDLGLALNVIKHQRRGAIEILKKADNHVIDGATAVFMNRVANLKLEIDEGEEKVDVCKAMEDYTLKVKVLASIDTLRSEKRSDEYIVKWVMDRYKVSNEYLNELMEPEKV